VKLLGNYVLDSFALLAYLADEEGANLVREVLEHGQRHAGSVRLSVINLGECLYIIEREQGLTAAHKAVAAIEQLSIEVAVADRARTFAAAHIKARYRVSYADAFAIALAQESVAAVVTGDPEFKEVERLMPVLWLPRH
jgi:predicted nucleic acid-binding protein